LAWITGLRLAFLTVLLVATAFFYLRGEFADYDRSQSLLFATIGGAYALAAAYAVILRSGRHLRTLAEVQIVLDQVTWTILVYVSGGPTSGATSFYGLTCLVAVVLVGLRGAMIAALFGISLYVILCVGFATKWLLPPGDQPSANYVVEWEGMIYPLAINVLGIVVVALLAGYLADRIRQTGGALVAANARVLAAERLALLGRITAGLAHEIRNPLGSISGSIELLREAPGLSEEDRKLCDIVHREAARLNQLVGDMVDLAGPKKPKMEDVDVARLAREVVQLASRSERSFAGDVTVAYDGPIDPVMARCDGGQMRQVLWNLVRNGVQATAAGTTVTVAIRESADGVELSVSDEGPGIAPATSDKLFDAFYTTRTHGAGIGLAVVRRIIDDHARVGTSIAVRVPDAQQDARGASFVVSLRRSAGQGADDGPISTRHGDVAPRSFRF
jgi:signal transduction histidine kinase